MKKWLNFALQACCLISLCACFSKGGGGTSPDSTGRTTGTDGTGGTSSTGGTGTSSVKIYNNCDEITEPGACDAQRTAKLSCWWSNNLCLKLYAACADIDVPAVCQNNGNGQNKPVLKCKMDGGKCRADILDLAPPADAKKEIPAAYSNADWAIDATIPEFKPTEVPPDEALVVAKATLPSDGNSPERTLSVVFGNIVTEKVDAIVNAANNGLGTGGGVAGAIHRAAGSTLATEGSVYLADHRMTSFPTGAAMITPAHGLSSPIKYIIHTVGPVGASTPKTDGELYSAVYNSLTKASEPGDIKSIAIPAISTGIFGYPIEKATELFFKAALQFIADHPETSITDIRFTNFDSDAQKKKNQDTVTAIKKRFDEVFKP